MRIVLRYFFRTLRVLLAPFMILSEKLSTPKAVERAPDAQAEIDRACEDLVLYQFRTCPFCIKVRKQMARLGLNIELRDTQVDPQHKQDLQEGGGKAKVPCLKIQHPDGKIQWMYESDDINTYLEERFASNER